MQCLADIIHFTYHDVRNPLITSPHNVIFKSHIEWTYICSVRLYFAQCCQFLHTFLHSFTYIMHCYLHTLQIPHYVRQLSISWICWIHWPVILVIKRAWSCHVLCKRPGCYHSDQQDICEQRMIFKLGPILASVIYWIFGFSEFCEFLIHLGITPMSVSCQGSIAMSIFECTHFT